MPPRSSRSAACWGTLQSEILLSVAERLVISDIIRLQSVCTSWAWALGRSSLKHPIPSPLFVDGAISFFQPTPWLILPNSVAVDDCAFYSVIEDRLYSIPSVPQINNIGRRSLLGTSKNGWLVTIDHLLTPRFLNPLTKQELSHPSLITIPTLFEPVHSPEDNNNGSSLQGLWYNQGNKRSYYSRERFTSFVELHLKKIIILPSAARGVLAAVVLLKGGVFHSLLSFARTGDEAWSSYLNTCPKDFDFFEDITFNEQNKMLYALSNRGAVYILKCSANSIEIVSTVSRQIREYQDVLLKSYVFFSHGDLMQVTWNLRKMGGNFSAVVSADDPAIFSIFKFNRQDPQISADLLTADVEACCCWVRVSDLGGGCLFVDNTNCCFIMDCGEEEEKQRRNRVCFIYNVLSWQTRLHCDYGVFDLKSGRIVEDLESVYDIVALEPLPIWFMPALSIV
ncbi:hypothetical protein KSP40_PGU012088 [Platanthera guangdongensis]|uniref:KIB1-4 beta-propeller domain-containing protein n=1 Tax=Platanthera guangdongensis TaxID=2320717 RepID=A0ABR2MM46_9ASPA